MKAFSLIELIFVVSIISLITYITLPKTQTNDLELITSRMVLYLKQTRHQAFIEDNYDHNDELWHKKRWSMKFLNCNKNVGGIYYIIYSDRNKTGQIKKEHTLKDPLTKKHLYSFHTCKETKDSSKYVLLTKEFGINNIKLSCNSTNSLGQISFGSDGRVYSKLSNKRNHHFDFEIKKPCILTLFHKDGTSKSISIESKTGYIQKI